MNGKNSAALQRAIRKAGGRKAFQEQLQVSRERVNYWLKIGRVPMFEMAREIERRYGIRFA